MRYISTNGASRPVGFGEAVMNGMPEDGGLYVPETMPALDPGTLSSLSSYDFHRLSFEVIAPFVDGEIPEAELSLMIAEAFDFALPVVPVGSGIRGLELFHGPTCAFKDFGARFMARILAHFARVSGREVTIVTATSGDTGSAVAQAFHGVAGVRVFVLYPAGRVSPVQEAQLATLGGNISSFEVDGSFDDCQRLVKASFADADIQKALALSSANSINIARLVPQAAYFADAVRQLVVSGQVSIAHEPAGGRGFAATPEIVVAVPSGNFGDLTAGLYARALGIPISRFIAATNVNDTVPRYLETGTYSPKPSVRTIANAMDVGAPSNFARILHLFGGDVGAIRSVVSGFAFTDEELRGAIAEAFRTTGYVLDPHGAAGYLALRRLGVGEKGSLGLFVETAHPAKFRETVEPIIGRAVDLPEVLKASLGLPKLSRPLANDIGAFKRVLLVK
jgi:threonine synthase